ncbi:MAG: MurR/RpiR family transcriptional regulator [Brevibacterium aurantiacum]|uniref:MurR/RpiR family transcriptional regulator n=1 Tax=Brevibacterium aurantiacum TaxID=273384 RepID=UPI003F90850F
MEVRTVSSFSEWVDTLRSATRLTRATKTILGVIKTDPEEAAYCSAQALADIAEVNVATVVRAAQSLGYSGWPAFSAEIRTRYLASLSPRSLYLHNRSQGLLATTIDKDIELLERMRDGLDESTLNRMSEHIIASESTGVFATGSYAAPGMQLSHVAQMLGYRVRLHSGSVTSMVNEVNLLTSHDCFLAITLWKSSRAVVQLAEVAREQGAKVLVIADRRTALTDIADEYVLVPAESSELISSLVCATSAVQYLLGCLARHDEERTQSMLGRIDDLWGATSAIAEE